jgi:excisionase family DNA binding protein
MVEKALTVKEVAKILNVQKRTVQRLMKSRKLPGFKVGKEWRIKDIDLNGWINRASTMGGK